MVGGVGEVFREDGIELGVEAAAGGDFGAAELGGCGEELFADVGGVGDDGDVAFVGGGDKRGEVESGGFEIDDQEAERIGKGGGGGEEFESTGERGSDFAT